MFVVATKTPGWEGRTFGAVGEETFVEGAVSVEALEEAGREVVVRDPNGRINGGRWTARKAFWRMVRSKVAAALHARNRPLA